MLKFIIMGLVMSAAICLAQSTVLWECHYCHQQYIGNNPPPFAKCPAKDNKSNHWWFRKSVN